MALKVAVEGSDLNWNAAGSWVGGSAPEAADDVLFPPGGTFIYTTGPSAPVNLASMVAEAGSVVRFSGALVMNVNNSGKGVIWRARAGNLPLNGDSNLISIETPLGVDSSGMSLVQLIGGAHASVLATGGARIDVSTNASVGSVAAMQGGLVNIAGHASDKIDMLRAYDGGRIISKRTARAGVIADGYVSLEAGATVSDSGNGYLEMVHERAVLRLVSNGALTLDEVRCFAGTIDPTLNTGGVVLTRATRTPASRITYAWAGGTLTITTPTNLGSPGHQNGRFAGVSGA